VVLKTDGLAAGKGIVIAEDRAAADAAVSPRSAALGTLVPIVFEFLVSRKPRISCSLMARHIQISPPQDKRIFDNDRGPNTGGWGLRKPARDAG
jgi:phosphoribosylamine--glycine ligase